MYIQTLERKITAYNNHRSTSTYREANASNMNCLCTARSIWFITTTQHMYDELAGQVEESEVESDCGLDVVMCACHYVNIYTYTGNEKRTLHGLKC